MNHQFNNISTETDTHIISSIECELDGYGVLYQRWTWDGITGESFIFMEADIGGLNDEALEAITRKSTMVETASKITMTRNRDGFAFVNFNFKEIDNCIDFDAVIDAVS